MASIQMVVDDVLLAVRKKMAPATEERRVTVPGYVSGRKQTLRLQVSAEGASLLDKMVADAEKSIADIDAEAEERRKAAWAPLLKLVTDRDAEVDRRQGSFTKKPRGKKTEDTQVTEQGAEPTSPEPTDLGAYQQD